MLLTFVIILAIYQLCFDYVESQSCVQIQDLQIVCLQSVHPADIQEICPGEDVILSCNVTTITSSTTTPTLVWRYTGSGELFYNKHITTEPTPHVEGLNISVKFFDNTSSTISNLTIANALVSHNNLNISCSSNVMIPGTVSMVKSKITIAGATSPPLGLSIKHSKPTLTWLPPAGNLNCNFTYTVNITNSSSVTEQMYSNSTSLILTDLTRGENYSFAVAVTDSTGQHGPWSEELRVTWDGEQYNLYKSYISGACMHVQLLQ